MAIDRNLLDNTSHTMNAFFEEVPGVPPEEGSPKDFNEFPKELLP